MSKVRRELQEDLQIAVETVRIKEKVMKELSKEIAEEKESDLELSKTLQLGDTRTNVPLLYEEIDLRYTYEAKVFKEIWNNLSAVDVSDSIKKKNNLSYLPWSNAWSIMMEHYPGMKVYFHEPEFFSGSAIVTVTVTIGCVSRTCFLPIMEGYKNSSVLNPLSRDVGDSWMRCMVKCFALFGLGISIYTGEDIGEGDVKGLNPTNKDLDVNAKLKKDQLFAGILSPIIKETNDIESLHILYKSNEKEFELLTKTIKDDLIKQFTERKAQLNGK